MLLIILITLLLIGFRLAGNVNVVYQACAHLFLGGLIGYSVATHEWLAMVCSILLCLTESYMVLTRFIPSLAIANLIKWLETQPAPKK